MEVTKHGPAVAHADSTASYSIAVTNRGPDDASSVVVTDPIDLSQVSVVSLPADCVLDGGTIICLPGALAVGQTKTLSYTVHVAAGAQPGTAITNCAAAGSELAAVREEPNPACVQTVVLPSPTARVAVTKTAPLTIAPGGTLVYVVTVTNFGPSAAADVIVKDPVQQVSLLTIMSKPSECTVAAGTVTCALGTIAAGETRVLRATARVNDDVANGTVLGNCAPAYSPTENPDIAHAQSCVNTVVIRPTPTVPVTG